MTSKIKEVAESVIEAADKAHPRPWERNYLIEIYPQCDSKKEQDDNAAYIVEAANNAEKLARAVLIMQNALERIKRGTLAMPDAVSNLALTEVDALFSEDGKYED